MKVCTFKCTSDADCDANIQGTACFDVTYCVMDGHGFQECSTDIPADGSDYYMTYKSGSSSSSFCMAKQNIGKICEGKTQSCSEGYICKDGLCWAENRACKTDDECVGGRHCKFVMYCADDSEVCSDDSRGMTSMTYEAYSDEEFGIYSIGRCFMDSVTCDAERNSCALGYYCDSLTDGRCVAVSE